MFRLDGKIALVTGAGQNVGAGIARTLAAQGATVVVNDYHPTRAETICDEIRNAGGKAEVAAFDVTDLGSVLEAFTGVAKELGPVNILVNNAGTGGPHGVMKMAQFRDMPTDYWKGIIDVNLFGVLNCCKAAIDSMVERGWGRIITISSGAGTRGLDIGVSPYAAAKAGAAGFMRHLAMENAASGVTCNTIALGLVTDNPGPIQKLADAVPVKRLGRPEDPGYLCAYLASEESSWFTGQTLHLDGGATTT
jgi:NAD(P)-dependent dehydrogenase (short-subunit alcohol dehydrogenase family)